jgi:hypothetical protein
MRSNPDINKKMTKKSFIKFVLGVEVTTKGDIKTDDFQELML